MTNSKLYFCLFFLFHLGFLGQSQDLQNIKQQKPFGFHTGITLQSQYYHVNGIDPRRDPFSYTLSGSPVISLYGITLPFFFRVSNHNERYQQPFNQFGINPYYKWAKFHIGNSSVRFSPFTLAGHRFLGVGTELNPGKFRFGAVYGRFNKAVVEDTSIINDPNNYLLSQPVPAYSRNGYSFKLGVGTRRNHVDLIYFKAKDKANSIPLPTEHRLLPEENAVIGLSSVFHMFKKLSWKMDLGLSANTRNQFSDSLDISSWGASFGNTITKIILPRNSTQVSFAGETSLAFTEKNFSLKVLYRRVDPEYKSMGVYYMQKDMEQISVAPSFSLLKRTLRFNGTFGFQKNNLYKTRSATTKRIIGSANVSYNPGKIFSINLNYSNYGISQNPQTVSLTDTTLLEQISQNLSISPRLTFIRDQSVHTFFLFGNYNELSDNSESIIYKSQMQSTSANLTYNLNWVPKKLSVNASILYRQVSTVSGKFNNIGFNAGLNKRMLNDKFSFSANYTFYANTYEGQNNGNTHQIRGRVNMVVLERHQFFVQSYYIKNTSQNVDIYQPFNEFTLNMGCNLIISTR